MTPEQAVELIEYVQAMHSIMLRMQYYGMVTCLLLMILGGFYIGYVVGGKR